MVSIMKIIFVAGDPKPERWTVPIQALLPEAEIHVWNPDAPTCNADYAIVWQPPAELFEREKNLKAVFNLGAGIDGLLQVPNLPRHIPVVRLEDAGMSVQMAEYVAYHVIKFSRDMTIYESQRAENVWRIHRPIERKTWPIGILGLGHIGKRVARTLAALEYPVHGWARSQHQVEGVQTYAGQDQLKNFLGETRVLVNTLPLTPETQDILNYELMSSLKPNAILINVGRGEHLVEEDLCRAIEDGHISHAVLDVFRQEPLPAEHPFWQMPQIAITPHVSARTLRDDMLAQITGKIRALEAGQTITGIVDMERGY